MSPRFTNRKGAIINFLKVIVSNDRIRVEIRLPVA